MPPSLFSHHPTPLSHHRANRWTPCVIQQLPTTVGVEEAWKNWKISIDIYTLPGDLATWCKELTHLKRPWCWEWLKARGEEDYRGWDDWMASPTRWTWVRVNSGSWWWTWRPGMLRSMGLQSRTWLSDWIELKRFPNRVSVYCSPVITTPGSQVHSSICFLSTQINEYRIKEKII